VPAKGRGSTCLARGAVFNVPAEYTLPSDPRRRRDSHPLRPRQAGMVGRHPERIRVASRTRNMGKGSARGRDPLFLPVAFDNQSRFARSVGLGLEDPFAANHMISFAAVSRMDSVRCIIASTVLRGWKLQQFDAATAFASARTASGAAGIRTLALPSLGATPYR
jgi:hypothetical protein